MHGGFSAASLISGGASLIAPQSQPIPITPAGLNLTAVAGYGGFMQTGIGSPSSPGSSGASTTRGNGAGRQQKKPKSPEVPVTRGPRSIRPHTVT